MNREELYTAKILINDKEAENAMNRMQKELDVMKRKYQEALSAGDAKGIREFGKEVDRLTKKLDKQNTYVKAVNNTLENMSTAKQKELEALITRINKKLNSGAVERNSKEWKTLTNAIKEAKTELQKMKVSTEVQIPTWKRFFNFLNSNWGAFTQIIGMVTGLTLTIRKTVKDYADMEEAMADTRKYTGLADAAIRELNEDLKKMDTRTSREELNELAGAAGRLGKTSKQDILDFVEAGNMIKVALGDDLGEGAIDKVGKLAMAFGEDERMGLRGAMLATGSAINELAQNSSAQAGYLVDFTARVAGFGKQLGLTQAQIMGFGAVMDENLLRDEMAATAFGNMLTKMQTDTAKFAKIAGMDIEKFSKLLKEDANGAILALADSLKRAEPQTMMKMLDDMGLDGSRAVGVLSTLADKIDDVRARQELATKAYAEGTSVQKEYSTMNNTVQADIEKAKKRFHELSIELGERLQPIIKYTITSGSLVVKILSTTVGFLTRNAKEVAFLAGMLAVLTAAWNFQTVAMKLSNVQEAISIGLHKTHTFILGTWKQAVIAVQMAIAFLNGNIARMNGLLVESKLIGMANPWVALVTVLATLSIAIWGATKAWKAHRDELNNNLQALKDMRAQKKLEQEVNKQVAESTAERKTRIEQLNRVIHSNVYTVNERRNAIKALQAIVPEYHASITQEGKLYNENSNAIEQYIANLNNAAMAEAIYAKKVEINKKKLELNQQGDRIRGSLKAVQAYRDTQPQTRTQEWVDMYGIRHSSTTKTESALNSDRQEKRHKERLKQNQAETRELEVQDKWLDKQLEDNKALNKEYLKRVQTNNTITDQQTGGNSSYSTTSSNEGSGSGTTIDYYAKGMEELKENRKQQLLELRISHEQMQISDKEYHEKSFKSEMDYYSKVLDLQHSYGKSTVDTQNAILDSIAKEANRKYTQQHEEMQAELAAADDAYQSDKMAMMQLYLRGELGTEEDYNNKKKEAEMDYLKQRLSIIRKFGGDTQKADAAILEKEFEDFANDKKKRLDDLNKSFKEADTFSKQVEINEAMYAQDLISFEEYQQRKQQIAQESSDRQREINNMLYQQIGATMQSVSSLFSAMQNSEIAEVENRYDKQIQAAQKAGRNTTQLEKKKEKEIAKIKSKYADREFAMKILEITADTAVGIAKLWKNPGYPWAIPLTALVAARGAMQLAVAKQAQQNAKKGYYEGGFTGGRRYHHEAGVVHEGEFVANHQTVQNPNVMPLLELIDRAQRNNTVGSISQEDIARQLGTGNNTIAPIVNVTTDNEEMRQSVESLKNAADSLSDRLSEPQPCYVVMDGPNGLYIQLKHYENLKKL